MVSIFLVVVVVVFFLEGGFVGVLGKGKEGEKKGKGGFGC